MARIELKNVCIHFPIYSHGSRSLKTRLIQMATGASLNTDRRGHVVVQALNNISFAAQPGDRIGLWGHNGSGKTTLLRVLNSIYHPSSGFIRIEGHVGSLIDITLGCDPEATGRENIYLRAALLGIHKTELNRHLDDLIEFSELGPFIDMPMRTYSTGMHLRLAFAVATLKKPEILLMDEWLSVGDEGFQHKAEERLGALIQNSQILVIASHSKELLLKTCNRLIWLEHGQIKAFSDPDALCHG